MGLARVWRRRLYASVGLTVVVPAALMISLALLALGGGSFSLASLKQLVSGPTAPAGQPVALGAPGRGLGSHGGAATATLVASVAAPVASRSTGHGSRPAQHGGNPVGGRGTGGGSGRGGQGSGSGGGGRGGGSGGGGHSGGGGRRGGGGGPRPSQTPTVVDRVVNTVTPVTAKLPVAGPLVTQVVKSAGSVADQILNKLPVK